MSGFIPKPIEGAVEAALSASDLATDAAGSVSAR